MKKNINQSLKNINFPPKELLEEVRKDLGREDYPIRHFFVTNDNLGILDSLKYGFCQTIIDYKIKHDLDDNKLSQSLLLDRTTLQRILSLDLSALSLDSLLNYTERLQVPLRINISGEI